MEKIDISGFNPVKLLNIGTVNTLINNLSNIQNQLGKDLDDVTLFYRGHADKSWELIPGIYRNNRFINKEDFLVHNLIRHCPVDFQSCNSSFEKLVKMQHYELPTRLLDISMNPLVGLYFAVCSEMDKDGELIIFFIKNSDISNYDDNWVSILSRLSFMSEDIVNVETDSKKWQILISNLRNLQEPLPYLHSSSDLNRVICVLPKLDNPRIIRQHGAFFLFGIEDGKKENMAKLESSMIKCNIPAKKEKRYIKTIRSIRN